MSRHAPRLLLMVLGAALMAACGGSGGASSTVQGPLGSDLSGFRVARITVDTTEFEAWIAETSAQHQQGFMQATPQQLEPLSDGTRRGMLFVFASDRFVSFFMQDTYVPLDIAYIRSDGTIAEIHALQPLDATLVPSGEAVRYALEVNAGDLAASGLGVGSTLALPIP